MQVAIGIAIAIYYGNALQHSTFTSHSHSHSLQHLNLPSNYYQF